MFAPASLFSSRRAEHGRERRDIANLNGAKRDKAVTLVEGDVLQIGGLEVCRCLIIVHDL